MNVAYLGQMWADGLKRGLTGVNVGRHGERWLTWGKCEQTVKRGLPEVNVG